MNRLKGNTGYGEVFAMYWMAYCVIASFSSVFLLANGYSNTEIGILIATGNLVSVVIQPIAANFADRSKAVNLFEITGIMAVLILFSQGLLIMLHGKSLILFGAYLIMFALHAAMQPLLNSMNGTLLQGGIRVDYGSCRAMGSLGYALISAFLSIMVIRFTENALPVAGEIVMELLLIGLVFLNCMYKKAPSLKESVNGDAAQTLRAKQKAPIIPS